MDGADGQDGEDGQDGKSAFEYAQDGGYTGTEADFAKKIATEANGIDPNLNLLVLGDSLFHKTAAREWIKGFGCKVANYSLSGASIAQIPGRKQFKDGSYNSLLDQIERFQRGEKQPDGAQPDFTHKNGPDMILIDGGANDYIVSSRLAVMNTAYTYMFNDDDNLPAAMNLECTSHGLFYLFRKLCLDYPKAQKFFMIMHRVLQVKDGDYYTTGQRTLWANTPSSLVARNFNFKEEEIKVEYWERLTVDGVELKTIDELKTAVKDKKTIEARYYEATGSGGRSYLKYVNRAIEPETLFVDGNTSNEVDTNKVKEGYTYDQLYDTIVKECKKYGIKIIDLYNESPLNACKHSEVVLVPKEGEWQYYNEYTKVWVPVDVAYENENGNDEELHSSLRKITATYYDAKDNKTYTGYLIRLPNLELTDRQHIHPTAEGYKIGYDPYVKAALRLGTKK